MLLDMRVDMSTDTRLLSAQYRWKALVEAVIWSTGASIRAQLDVSLVMSI